MLNLIEVRTGDNVMHNHTQFCARVEACGTHLRLYDAAYNLTGIVHLDRATVYISSYAGVMA